MSIVKEGLDRLARLRSWAARTFLQPRSVTLLSIPACEAGRDIDEVPQR